MDNIWQERLSRTWPNYVIGDKIRPMDMEDASETPIIQCIIWLSGNKFITEYKLAYIKPILAYSLLNSLSSLFSVPSTSSALTVSDLDQRLDTL